MTPQRTQARRSVGSRRAPADRLIDEPSTNLNDQALQQLRRDILWCVLAPGEEISEAQLASHYGFGKAPIRNALTRLRQEGLVEVRPRKRFQVVPVTIRDVHELFGVRLILEPATARLAAGRIDDTVLLQLDATVKAGYRPGDRASEAAFLDANRKFHLAVAQAAGNERLTRIITQVIEECDRVLHLALATSDLSGQFQHEHRTLIDALRNNDPDAAESLTFDAIAGGRDAVLQALLASPTLMNLNLASVQ